MTKEKDTAKKTPVLLTREEIFGSEDIKIEPVDLPEWGEKGGRVFVKTLTGNERDAWEERMVNSRKTKGGKLDIRLLKAQLVIASVCDESGARIFVPTDAEELNAKSSKCLDQLSTVAQRLSGISEQEAEEIAGN